MKQLICVAGASGQSSSLTLKIDQHGSLDQALNSIRVSTGPYLSYLDSTDEEVYFSLRTVLDELSRSLEASLKPEQAIVVCSIAGTEMFDNQSIVNAIRESKIGKVPEENIFIIERGEACYWATCSTNDLIIAKSGTTAFAQAFRTNCKPLIKPLNWRVGGWGAFSGFDGGAYDIGRHLLYQMFREYDYRSPHENPSYQKLGYSYLDIRSLAEWIRNHRVQQTLRKEIASLAPTVTELAEKDRLEFAFDLFEKAGEQLASNISIAIDRAREQHTDFGTETLEIYLHGCLMQASLPYTNAFIEAVRNKRKEIGAKSLNFKELPYSPIIGCIVFGMLQINQFSWQEIVDRLTTATFKQSHSPFSVPSFSDVISDLIRDAK